jgi:hypothetical protein
MKSSRLHFVLVMFFVLFNLSLATGHEAPPTEDDSKKTLFGISLSLEVIYLITIISVGGLSILLRRITNDDKLPLLLMILAGIFLTLDYLFMKFIFYG